jgi:PAS domain S-box-containing protein
VTTEAKKGPWIGQPDRVFWNRAAELAAVAALYFLLAKSSLEFATLIPSATPIWPPTGLAIAIVLLRGYRVLPAILVGAFLANATTAGGLLASVAIAGGNSLEAWVAAFLVNRLAGGAEAFRTPFGIGQFGLAAIAAATPVSATIGVTALSLAGSAPWSSYSAVWVTWWLGDAAGAIMVAPAIVLWTKEWRSFGSLSYETFALHAFAVLVGAVAFGPLLPEAPERNALAFLAVLPLIWTALRRGPRDTSTVALVLSAFAVWGVAIGESPFTQPTLNASFLLLIAFVASVTLPTLALSAAVASRDRALAENELAVRAGGIGIWDWDVRTNTMTYSEHAKAIFGFPADGSVSFEQVRDATHPDDLPRTSALARRALDPKLREKQPYEYRIVRTDGAVRWLLAHGDAFFDGDRAVRYFGTIQDITERKLLTEALAASETKLKLALHAGRLAIWEYRGSTDAIIGSPDLNELLGFPRDRQVATDEYRARYAEGESERIQAIARAALQGGARSMQAEAKFILPTGEPRWLLLRADFVPSSNGRRAPDLLGIAVDITQQKKAEEHLRLLIGELNHRVKNMLAIVQSVIAQTLRTSDPKLALANIEGRLQALAQAHDILTSSAWQGADLRTLVLASVSPHMAGRPERMLIEGPPVHLPARFVVPISMIFHELATNALKYGSLSSDAGTVEIAWSTSAGDDAAELDLRWRERGGPVVERPSRPGFGLRMIERSVASELGGRVQLDFQPTGLVCDLHLVVPSGRNRRNVRASRGAESGFW